MRTPRLPVVDWTYAPCRFKLTSPFRRKTKSGFCACAITFRTQSTRRTSQAGQNKRVGTRQRYVPRRWQVRFEFPRYRKQRLGSTRQMMLEMVHDRTATGVTRAVWMATVLLFGKQMEKRPHYYFFLGRGFPETEKIARCSFWWQYNLGGRGNETVSLLTYHMHTFILCPDCHEYRFSVKLWF